jgi:hypothetical protein
MKTQISFFTLICFVAFGQPKQSDEEIHKMITEIKIENLKQTVKKLVSFGTRHTLSDTKSNTTGIGAAQRWVKSEFEKYAAVSEGRLSASIDFYMLKPDGKRIPNEVKLANVKAVLKGTNPNDNRVLIIGSHLDSRATDVMDSKSPAPGANDDGSGVAATLEICRILANKKFPFKIMFLTFSGEEQGLYGSKHLADSLKTAGVNVIAMLNNDMIGNSQSSGTNLRDNTKVRLFSETIPLTESENEGKSRKSNSRDNDSNSRNLARYVQQCIKTYVPQLEGKLIFRTDRYLRGSDHLSFMQAGFTAIRICEYNENFEHQHQDVRVEKDIQFGDLPEFIDFDYLKKTTATNLAALASLGFSPKPPTNVGIQLTELSNFSTISWDVPKDEMPFGYQILIRETSASTWEQTIFTTKNKIVIPYSKDNYFFAVQSVDSNGNPSLAVFPTAIR